jgi:hypothetical protein
MKGITGTGIKTSLTVGSTEMESRGNDNPALPTATNVK